MPRGQVKWFDPKKGYGFIIGPEGQDVFVHYSHILSDGFKSLKDGQWVDYELLQGEKGWQARSVHAADDAEPAAAEPGDETGPTDRPPASRGYEGASSRDDTHRSVAPPRSGGYEGAGD